MAEWSPVEIETLINLVFERPALYDQKLPGYSNLNTIDNLWQEISLHFPNKKEAQLKKKWQILRTGYRTRRGSKLPGLAHKWIYYENLSFLEPFMTERSTTSESPSTSTSVSEKNTNGKSHCVDRKFVLKPADIKKQKVVCKVELGLQDSDEEKDCDKEEFNHYEESQLDDRLSPVSELIAPDLYMQPTNAKKRNNGNDLDETFVAYLQPKTQPKKRKSSNELFLASLLDDMELLSASKLRKFKLEILNTLNELLEE